jgi:hypothetical protein
VDITVNPAFVIFTAISPLFIALVKQKGFAPQVNALIALGCYVVVGVAGVLLSGEPLTLENATGLITLATVIGTAAYQLVWNNLAVTNSDAPSLDTRLTNATSIFKG